MPHHLPQRTSETGLRLSGPQAQRGQSLIEALIGLGILLILFHALASLIIAAYDLLGNSRVRITARYIALGKMEEIRNLSYNSVGVAGGIPSGVLTPTETVNRNGLDYTIKTAIIFIDDPFDQLAPADSNPTDYKRTRVDVSWTGRFIAGESVTLVTDFSSQEATSGGTLSILVFDANAAAVPQADVRIINTAVSPQIDLSLKTDASGSVFLPGSPPCSVCYQISVTKENYSTDRTYSTSEVPNPFKPHVTVTQGQVTQVSFSIDRTANLSFYSTLSRDDDYTSLPNKVFHLSGGKTIGTDGLGLPVKKYDQELQTNTAGSLTLQNLEWDTYQLTLPAGSWDLAGTNPIRPIVVLPNTQLDLLFASATHSTNSLLLSVTDASGSAIASASAHLTGPGSYDKSEYTGETGLPDFGQIFLSSLQAGSYSAQVTKAGFLPRSESINVSGQTEYTVQLDSL